MRRVGEWVANVGWAPFFPLILLISGCSIPETPLYPPMEGRELAASFGHYEIIGEGTHFLTLKCDMPGTLPPGVRVYALVLDADGYPVPKVSGYTHNPRLEGRNHLWFYFFLYDPRKAFHLQRESRFVKFIVTKGEKPVIEKIVMLRKTWGTKEGAKILDLPSPPDEIPGYLILKDYAFYAEGDLRRPLGYYVEGTVSGHQGEWTRFTPRSDVVSGEALGGEDVPAIDTGWLELSTGRSHSMKEAVTPSEPYVEGWWDGKGYFHPGPAAIHGFKK